MHVAITKHLIVPIDYIGSAEVVPLYRKGETRAPKSYFCDSDFYTHDRSGRHIPESERPKKDGYGAVLHYRSSSRNDGEIVWGFDTEDEAVAKLSEIQKKLNTPPSGETIEL